MTERGVWPRDLWLDAIWDCPDVKPSERAVAYAYARYAGASDITWCSWDELRRRTGIRSRDALSRANGIGVLASEVGATEEEMRLLIEKTRRDHPHVKVPSRWLRRVHEHGDLPAMLAELRVESTRAVVPEWCGECDERTRQVELADGRVARCSRCHPLRRAAS